MYRTTPPDSQVKEQSPCPFYHPADAQSQTQAASLTERRRSLAEPNSEESTEDPSEKWDSKPK